MIEDFKGFPRTTGVLSLQDAKDIYHGVYSTTKEYIPHVRKEFTVWKGGHPTKAIRTFENWLEINTREKWFIIEENKDGTSGRSRDGNNI